MVEAVERQVDGGIDVVSDSEMSKMSYHVYAKHRLKGLANRSTKGIPGRPRPQEFADFPEMLSQRQADDSGPGRLQSVVCVDEVSYADYSPLNRDIANLGAVVAKAKPVEAFMNSASPGVLVNYVPNDHYRNDDAYREALVEAMRPEYEAIHAAGFVLQLDCPDLAGSRHTDQQDLSDREFLAFA